MSHKIKRRKLLTDKQIIFYGNMDWKAKSYRLRKKARKIINQDGSKFFSEDIKNIYKEHFKQYENC